MAQPFSLRYPLVDGSGNFGSLDGDAAAAMRYTECRLARISDEMLQEIDQATVTFRPNYDGTKTEPVVLPARLPNLLVNGATGIAVGMATSIPPHHLGEVATALLKLLDNADLTSAQLCRYVKGPDFPTGGHVLNSPDELKDIYKTGSGTLRVRGTWEPGPTTRGGRTIIITSIPYMVNKAQLVERIAEVVLGRKLPPLVDVKDISTDDVRIQLELKRDADEKMVMAYLCRHTPLQTTFPVNLTCLVPTENPEVGRPDRLDLKSILWHFLHFRLDVVTRRLEHELAAVERRIHVLEGFERIFGVLDEIIRIIRKSDGKQDAAKKIMARFDLDAGQTDAILERSSTDWRASRSSPSRPSSRTVAGARRRSDCCSTTSTSGGGSCGTSWRTCRSATRGRRRTRAARASRRSKRSSTPPATSSSRRTASSSCRATDG